VLFMFDTPFEAVKGIIFDLDGTLLTSSLNFMDIRQQIKCPPQQDILGYITGLSKEQQRIAERIVIEHEIKDALSAKWIPGAQQAMVLLQNCNIPMAIVTRNSKEATWLKIKNNNLKIDLVITREDAPPKPDPSALLNIATQWQIPVKNLVYIGDYLYDVQAANNAGMLAGLYAPEGEPDYAHLADWVFCHFEQLTAMFNGKVQ
jgi:HAD superfamily hydrolase (TIGR01509 family)